MGLTVENGSGLSNADSYLSVADADTYYALYSSLAAWATALTAAKERALRLATRFLDARYGRRWIGTRVNAVQALDWPRMGVCDSDGFALDSTVIPQAVKNAVAEAAFRVAAGEDLQADLESSAGVIMESVKVGPIEETKQYSEPDGPLTEYQVIDGLLRRLLRSGNEIRRA
jgi:hypothetical protein